MVSCLRFLIRQDLTFFSSGICALQNFSASGVQAASASARVAQGKERCELAANGAPDCQTAAENLCRKQGFAGGKSLDFTSAEECPARVYLSGRHSPGECKTVTFISRAMCQ